MKVLSAPKFQTIGFFLLLVIFCCAPVWSVEFFINQDGSAHLYSAQIMLELLKGNPVFSEIFSFNSFAVPNSSGHWLMALLLIVLPPFVVTKIIVTLTFAGFIASVGWLRLKTVGVEGLKTSLLFGAAIGFNWLWLCGFYNFLIGVGCFVFTVGLIFCWREKMNFWRTGILGLLFLIAYLSHIVSFAILTGSVFLLFLSGERSHLKRNLLCFFAALLPVLPLAIIYKSISAGGGFFPVWRNLENPFSPLSWLLQMRTADPFILISRKSFPFITGNSIFFVLFTPIFWIFAALFSLAVASFYEKEKPSFFSGNNLIFGFLFFSCVLAAMIAPDDFGLNNGSILRERLLICGLIFFVPLFRADNSVRLKRFAKICLTFVIIFQTAALWEYSLQANSIAKEFLSAKTVLAADDRLASVVLIGGEPRFNSTPATMLNNYHGIEKNVVVWDNYEIGHYLFPVVAKNPSEKQFVFDLTRYNTFNQNDPQNFDEKLLKFESFMTAENSKIKTIVLWGKDEKIDTVLSRWFDPQPIFENGRVRVIRHK